jgi:hypothetical protein
LSTKELLRGADADVVTLTLTDGKNVTMRCANAVLHILDVGEVIDTFEGKIESG